MRLHHRDLLLAKYLLPFVRDVVDLVRKRMLQSHQNVQNNSQRIHIHSLVVRLIFKNLRRHVSIRPN